MKFESVNYSVNNSSSVK